MRRYRGNETVDPGIYFNRRELRFKSMAEEGRLPGGADGTWVRVPALTLLVAGPLLGAVYAIFLPFIGFVMLFGAAGAKLKEVVGRARTAAPAGRPAWQAAGGGVREMQGAEVVDARESGGEGEPPAG